MKIAVTTYPMLWQRTGGLQIQIQKSIECLLQKNVNICLFDDLNQKLKDYDIVHIFSLINCTHLILREAKAQGIRTVVSPNFQPDYSYSQYARFRIASWLARRITSYQIHTTFDNICSGIQCSDHFIALSSGELRVLKNAYKVPDERITLIPNGIDSRFFAATPSQFMNQFGVEPGFILVVGSISAYKNQLGVIRASAGLKEEVILIGGVGDPEYLAQCLEEGGKRVRHVGILPHNDSLLSSAYAAAGVTVLASAGESFGLAAVESLASGTPAIVTDLNGLDLSPFPPLLTFVDPKNSTSLRNAIHAALATQQSTTIQCRDMVAHLKWDTVGDKLLQVYQKLVLV